MLSDYFSQGFSFIDVISPCVTFNNHVGSTKSFEFVRDNEHSVTSTDYVPEREEITVEYETGSTVDVMLHDNSHVRLRKLTQTMILLMPRTFTANYEISRTGEDCNGSAVFKCQRYRVKRENASR